MEVEEVRKLISTALCETLQQTLTYVTVPEKRDFDAQNKKIEFLMLVGRLNPSLLC